MALEVVQLLAGLDVPQAHTLVACAAGKNPAAVSRKGHAPDRTGVPFEQLHLLAAFDLPEPQGSIAAAREGKTAISREDHAVDALRVSLKGSELLARLEVPEAHERVVPTCG